MAEPGMNDTLEPGEIRFVDNYVPLLEAGHYTIEVTQSLEGRGAYQAERSFNETQKFTVSGPHFRLDPSDIYAVFPPPNSQGKFKYDLPHIVLTKRALPWERSIVDDKTVPWMALLLFDVSEILPPIVGSNADSQVPNPAGVTTILVKELRHSASNVMVGVDPALLDEGDMQQSCQVIDIEPQTFNALMPYLDDAKYLAHCREVNMAPKAVAGPARPGAEVAPGNGIEWYSIVVGGRFPCPPPEGGQAGELNVVHLVSLEGFAQYLEKPEDFPEKIDRVRLVSLASWTFTCLPERGESFSELMLELVAQDRKETLEFRLPAQQPDPDATAEDFFAFRTLKAGYVPCSYHTRQGEQTFAWYRGPFTPQPVARFPTCRHPFLTSTQAMIFDQEHGLFDLSYAVAWETGRLLALSDQRFGVTLLNWRRKAHRLIDMHHERSAFSSLQSGAVMDRQPQQVQPLLGINLVTDAFMSHLLGHFAREIEPVIFAPANKQPTEPESRPPPTDGTGMSLVDLYQDNRVRQGLREANSEELDPICEWLSHLYLLYGVPFNNLVAHERLLPPESIRFFYLDRNWLEIMLDGALSIGLQSSRDTEVQQALHGIVRDRVHEQIYAMRDRLLGNEVPAPGEEGEGLLAGLLLRSAVVSGWPGLEVRAYRDSDGEKGSGTIGLLRMDHLSDDVLLCLFAQVPAWIEFDEPKEGLHFGIQVEEGTEKISLRHLSGPHVGKLSGKMGMNMPGCEKHRRLDIQDLLKEILKKKKEMEGLNENDDFGPAAFALQMVKDPQQMVFQTTQAS